MVAHIGTVAFAGIDARLVDVQVHVSSGLPTFTIVGLPESVHILSSLSSTTAHIL